jgi:hypothetical protein
LKFFFEINFISFSSLFLSICQGTLRVLRGANVASVF